MSWSASATLGSGTPSALPISRARPRSFLHISTLNNASAGMPRTNGPRYLTIGEAMTDLSRTSTARSRAIPAFSASATASLNASICTARLRFVATFIVTASPALVHDRRPDRQEIAADLLERCRVAADHEREL